MNMFKSILFLLSIAVAGALASESPACAGMEAGTKAYQESDFERAIDEWRSCADNGITDADLFYNLGNAYFRNGNLGLSIFYYKKALRLRANDSDIQQIVVQGGKSVQELHQWEQAKDKEYLKTLAALEEKGEIQSVATVASADDKKNTQAGIDTQRGEDLAGIAETFGEQAKAEAKALWDSYEQKLHQIDNQKLSPLERAELKQKATDELNRQRADFFIQKIQDMAIPDEQKQEEIAQLRKLYNAI